MKVDEFIQRHTVPDLDSEIFLKKINLSVDAALDTDAATVVRDPGQKKMKNRIGVIIAVVSPLIISYCLVSGGCQPSPGYITVDSRSGLLQPTFCLYRDASLQERLGIRTIVVWKVQRSTEFDSHWDRIEQVWSLSCIKPTSPVSCLTYGKVPPDYSEDAKAVPLEPEQFYSVWLPGFRGVDSEDRYFIIRLDDNGIPERLESH